MMNICDYKQCVGCGSCAVTCKQDAISMKYDEDGFVIPVIDQSKCMNCGSCYNACPVHAILPRHCNPECYAVQAEDNIRLRCSSGGVFEVLALQIIMHEHGLVAGAVFEDEKVRHIVSDKIDDIRRMEGAKYVQSEKHNCYAEIVAALSARRKVLFTGTPCEVAGLYAFLGSDDENLITVEVICQGVPSAAMLASYIHEISEGKVHIGVSFRDKSIYRWSSSFNLYFQDGSVFRQAGIDNPYIRAFRAGYSTRPSCAGNCQFNKYPRCADLTMGDFLGIWLYDKERKGQDGYDSFLDKKGTSLLSVNSHKGGVLLNACKSNFNKCVSLALPDVVENNHFMDTRLYRRYNEPEGYDESKRIRFKKLMRRHGFLKAFEYTEKGKYDIALIGLWYTNNYGAMITARALYQTVQQLGYEVVLVDSAYQLTERNEDILRYITERCNVSRRFEDNNALHELNEYCDTFLVGSDQCWNRSINNLFEHEFMLPFVAEKKKKISYSTSFGTDIVSWSDEERQLTQFYLSRFQAISVREKSAEQICSREFGCQAKWVIDPIFLLDKEDYKKDAQNVSGCIQPYGLNYVLDITKSVKQALDVCNKALSCKYKCSSTAVILGLDSTNEYEIRLDGESVQPDVPGFLKKYLECSFVVTDSYHGMCLAILLNKPFVVIINEGRGRTRFESLLSFLGLEEYAVEADRFTADSDYTALPEPNWDKVNELLVKFRQESLDWLRHALNQKHEKHLTTVDVLEKKLGELAIQQREMEKKLQWEHDSRISQKTNAIYRYFARHIATGDKIAVRGAGDNTKHLLEIIMPLVESKNASIKIFDKSQSYVILNKHFFSCASPDKLQKQKFDKYIVPSATYHHVFAKEIKGIYPNAEILDIYDDLYLDDSRPFFV